jgi:hypothetical protein
MKLKEVRTQQPISCDGVSRMRRRCNDGDCGFGSANRAAPLPLTVVRNLTDTACADGLFSRSGKSDSDFPSRFRQTSFDSAMIVARRAHLLPVTSDDFDNLLRESGDFLNGTFFGGSSIFFKYS